MPGLVDIAHAAPTKPIEDDVVADHQPAGLSLKNGLGLEPGQFALAVHFLDGPLAVALIGRKRFDESSTSAAVSSSLSISHRETWLRLTGRGLALPSTRACLRRRACGEGDRVEGAGRGIAACRREWPRGLRLGGAGLGPLNGRVAGVGHRQSDQHRGRREIAASTPRMKVSRRARWR